MARATIATVSNSVTALGAGLKTLREELKKVESLLNDQLADLEKRVDELEQSGPADQRKIRGRQMTEEQRKAAGERLQMARASETGVTAIIVQRTTELAAPGELLEEPGHDHSIDNGGSHRHSLSSTNSGGSGSTGDGGSHQHAQGDTASEDNWPAFFEINCLVAT